MKNYNILFLILLLLAAVLSCKEETKTKEIQAISQDVKPAKNFRIASPQENQKYVFGDSLKIKISLIDSSKHLDSTSIYINGAYISNLENTPFQYTFSKVGTHEIKTESWVEGKNENNRVRIYVYSDTKPIELSYKIINTYPHDIQAYTQGLVYENGYFYEGTGQFGGKSSIRKVKAETGKVLNLYTMLPEYFGEGIAIIQDKIYQITYKSQRGFVYDKDSFKELKSFSFPNNEGWGLTYDGKNLIMSDGSHILYYMDPNYFSEQKRIEVYDDKGIVDSLNELEYINGLIYANIYQKEFIVVIDPNTGKVIGKANITDLLENEDMHPRIDVLNGIAFDKINNKIYVTGKNWPKLFEIKFSPTL